MRGVRRLPQQFLMLFPVVLIVVIFVCAAATKGPWWIVQTSGLDTNLRAVAVGEYQEPLHGPVPVIWASGSNGVILQSKDEGKTWKQFHILGAEKLDFRGIRAFDAQEAYVMSSGDGDKSANIQNEGWWSELGIGICGTAQGNFLDALACDGSSPECMALSDPVEGKFLILTAADGEHWK